FFAFDELDWLTLTTPRISTVAQPIHHMGVHAAELLFRRIRETDLPVSWQTYQVEMKLRESVATIAENVKG
ncbi:substrate-binding domain-containing protein, partial [Klebsiella pneumoniae]